MLIITKDGIKPIIDTAAVINSDGVNKLVEPKVRSEKIAAFWDREAKYCDKYSHNSPMANNCRRIANEIRS